MITEHSFIAALDYDLPLLLPQPYTLKLISDCAEMNRDESLVVFEKTY